MNDIFDTILLLSLPGAGKSAIRKFLKESDPKFLKEELHFGNTLEIDDLQYVVFFNKIDEELTKMKQPGIFYPDGQSHYDSRDYGTLTCLLKEDYQCLKQHTVYKPESCSLYLFNRIDKIAEQLGLGQRFASLKEEIRNELEKKVDNIAKKIVESNNELFLTPLDGRTIVIELSRGSAKGASMPLTGTEGYQYTLPLLGKEILDKAKIIYLKIDEKESFRRNLERPFNIPEGVMQNNYGCDDMLYLLNNSSTIALHSEGNNYHIPVALFDAGKINTSFMYKPEHLRSQNDYLLFLDEMKKVVRLLYSYKK